MISGGAFSWILEHLVQEARIETVMCDMDKLDRGKEVLIIDAFFAQFWFQMTKPLSTKTDEFSEKFQTPIDHSPPPPHFRKIMLQICFNFMLNMPCSKVQNLQHKFLD